MIRRRFCGTRSIRGTGRPRRTSDACQRRMQFWVVQTLNSVAFGGLLFLLSSGFSLIFGLLRIPNLAHGALFMLGAYIGGTLLADEWPFWAAALASGIAVGVLGIAAE